MTGGEEESKEERLQEAGASPVPKAATPKTARQSSSVPPPFNFNDIDTVAIKFEEHPRYPEMATHLNRVYGGEIEEFEAIFMHDATTGDRIGIVDQVEKQLRQIIVKEITADATLTRPADQGIIKLAIDKASMRVSSHHGSGTKSRLSTVMMTKKSTEEIQSGKKPCRLNITIGFGHVFLRTTDINYLDWSQFTLDPDEELCEDNDVELSAAAEQQDRESKKEAMNFGVVIAEAVARAVLETNRASPAGSVGSGLGTPTVGLGGGASYTFNYRALPTSVMARYLNKVEHKPICGEDLKVFDGNNRRYYVDGTDRIILADGTLFVMGMNNHASEKEMLRNPITCKDDTYQGLRTWYETFAQHAMDHG